MASSLISILSSNCQKWQFSGCFCIPANKEPRVEHIISNEVIGTDKLLPAIWIFNPRILFLKIVLVPLSTVLANTSYFFGVGFLTSIMSIYYYKADMVFLSRKSIFFVLISYFLFHWFGEQGYKMLIKGVMERCFLMQPKYSKMLMAWRTTGYSVCWI